MSNEEQSQSRPLQFRNKCTQNHPEQSSECFEIILNGSGRKNRISWPPLQFSGIWANDNTQKQGVVHKVAPCLKFRVRYEFIRAKRTVTIFLGPFINPMSEAKIDILLKETLLIDKGKLHSRNERPR